MTPASVARVLLDSPLPQLDRLFDYAIPESMRSDAAPGVRVRVPLRSAGRIADGFIVEVAEEIEYTGALSELDAVVSSVPILAAEVWRLARRLADRAAGNASDIIRLAVPKRQVRVERAWQAAQAGEGGSAPVTAVQQLADYDDDRFDAALRDGGRLAVSAIPGVVPVSESWVGRWAVTMAAAASRAIQRGSVILVVPDYRDQEQLVAALGAVLPQERIVQLDARQSNADRYRAVLSCLEDTPRVIVGNRSAVYAPASSLALIALWDDGDPLHAEPLAPYVHSRDAALLRQEQQGCALAFFSHGRSAEVQRLVELGWLDEFEPTRAQLPRVIATGHQAIDDPVSARARIPSTAWREATAALERGPVLVQVARPGYAPGLACDSCGQQARCLRCEGPLSMPTARAVPSCRWCGSLATQWRCQNCGSSRFRPRGQGATRTAEDLGRAFPGVPVILADGQKPILAVPGTPALVIATRGAEPVAAGGYRAVLLLDGERMLARESLRVGEDCLRWWANAVALAASGAACVLAGVDGPIATALATWRMADFSARELADRRRLRFPPAVRVATVTGDAASVEQAVAAVRSEPAVDVLGPVETDASMPTTPGGGGGGGLQAVRAIVRFDYGRGAEVATALRAAVVRNAANRRKRVPAQGGPPSLPTLRVRFDDLEPFSD